MQIVCQYIRKLRQVLLDVSRQLGGFLEVRNLHSAEQFVVEFALGNLPSQLQHRHHISEILQSLDLQVVGADNPAPYISRHGIQPS